MKIIDEKGKLFGLINIIDLAVIIILALIVVGGARRLKSKPEIIQETSRAEIVYEIPEVRMVTIDHIKVGDELEHYDKGALVGTIKSLEYEPYKKPIEGDGEWIEAEVPGKYNAYITVEAEVNNGPDTILVGGEQTRIGGQYRMKNKYLAFFGTCLDIKVLD